MLRPDPAQPKLRWLRLVLMRRLSKRLWRTEDVHRRQTHGNPSPVRLVAVSADGTAEFFLSDRQQSDRLFVSSTT